MSSAVRSTMIAALLLGSAACTSSTFGGGTNSASTTPKPSASTATDSGNSSAGSDGATDGSTGGSNAANGGGSTYGGDSGGTAGSTPMGTTAQQQVYPAPPASPPSTNTYNIPNTPGGFATQLAAPIPPATYPMYANSEDTLYRFDAGLTQLTAIAHFSLNGQPFGQIFDIGIDNTGRIFGADFQHIYAINASTAELTLIGPLVSGTTFGQLNAMSVLGNGWLVMGGLGLFVVDPTTLKTQTLVPPGEYSSTGDVIYLPDGNLYWTVSHTTASDTLLAINPYTRAVTTIGDVGVAGIYGLGYANGVLYGFTAAGSVVSISLQTGKMTGTLNIPASVRWSGAASNPTSW